MNVINLTPHAIALHTSAGVVTYPSQGSLRLTEHDVVIDQFEGADVIIRTYSCPDLPPLVDGTVYIVSALVLAAVDRTDLISPDTGRGAVRDEAGRIIGTTAWVTR